MSPNIMISDLQEWLALLPPEFMFLLALPFLVAMVGLLADRRPAHGMFPSRMERIGVPAGIGTALALLAVAAD